MAGTPWDVYSVGTPPVMGVGGARLASGTDAGRGRCGMIDDVDVDGEVEVDDAGGVGRDCKAGTTSLGRGKNRTRPSGNWAAEMLLPYAFGVRMYEEDGACHVWGQAVSLVRSIEAGAEASGDAIEAIEAIEATSHGSAAGRSDEAGGGQFRNARS